MRRQTNRWEERPIRLLATWITIVVFAALFAPAASANCGITKFFRSGGSDSTENVRIMPGYPGQAPGNEIGRWWDSGNAALSSNFGANDGSCPSSVWWTALMNGNMQIDGILDGTGCVGYAGCPGLEMTVVVEDYGPDGPPGVNDTAYYVGFRVDDTPASLRRYDYGRTDNGEVGTTTYPFLEFPRLDITGSSSGGGGITLTYDMTDQDAHVHTAVGAADDPLPTNSVVAEFHVLTYAGTSDPGRERASGWTVVQTLTYVPGGSSGHMLTVPWPMPPNDLHLAVGIGFDGGAAGIIDSALVGTASVIEEILADPDPPGNQRFDRREPNPQAPSTRPRSAGGRR